MPEYVPSAAEGAPHYQAIRPFSSSAFLLTLIRNPYQRRA
jgi:hypothetical protein